METLSLVLDKTTLDNAMKGWKLYEEDGRFE